MSKYIIERRNKEKIARNIVYKNKSYFMQGRDRSTGTVFSYLFLFCYFFLPQYFGFNTPGFDLTAQRMGALTFLIYVLAQKKRASLFFHEIKKSRLSLFFAPYFVVIIYTAVLRTHIGSFMYDFIEFICIYIFIYISKYIINVDQVISFLQKLSLLLGVQGLFEFIAKRSFFSYLVTIRGLYTGAMIRSGSYRIMGPANHSLGYGLMLIVILALSTIDTKKHEMRFFAHPVLFLLVLINIMLTGSRSTLGVAICEILFFFICSKKEEKKRVFLLASLIITGVSLVTVVTWGSSFSNYILLQITSIIDTAFGTSYSVNFGADITTLYNSSNYRKYLPQIFTLDWLNPLLGRGSQFHFTWYVDGYYIKSLDNYYVVTYVKYAYPGLLAYLFFIFQSIFYLMKNAWKKQISIVCALLIGFIMYFVNLWWVDQLQTLKYVYMLISLGYVYIEYETKINERT